MFNLNWAFPIKSLPIDIYAMLCLRRIVSVRYTYLYASSRKELNSDNTIGLGPV